MKRRIFGTLLVAVCMVAVLPSTLAYALGSEVAHTYSVASGSSVVAGNLVSTQGSAATVVPANVRNGQQLIGVAVNASDSLVTITNATQQADSIRVATSGAVVTYVSTLAGAIHAGDNIAVSPLGGIGMKVEGTLRTVGVAQADFSATTPGAKPLSVKDKDGKATTVYVGSILVAIALGNGTTASTHSGLVGDIQTLAGSLIGHQVSVLQAVAAFLITIIAVGALIALVYGAIYGGIVSIGRNPLARASIYISLLQVIGMALLIVVIAIAILYFLLR